MKRVLTALSDDGRLKAACLVTLLPALAAEGVKAAGLMGVVEEPQRWTELVARRPQAEGMALMIGMALPESVMAAPASSE